MGISTGSKIIPWFFRGLYNQCPSHYDVYVDGELMRYKGMIHKNLTLAAPEEAIAHTAFECLNNTLTSLESMLVMSAKHVYVYMDGERVRNKTYDRAPTPLNSSLIRFTFKGLCHNIGYIVRELNYGESELQMYLDRERSCPLNVFITCDSDMISICYDHRPTIRSVDNVEISDEAKLQEIHEQARSVNHLLTHIHECDDQSNGITDINSTYLDAFENGGSDNPPKYTVVDSCMWLSNNGSYNARAIGMDFCRYRLKYHERVFRTFLALNGTDFTDCSKMCTPTMIAPFFNATTEDIEFINAKCEELYDTKDKPYDFYWNYLAAAILFLCVKTRDNKVCSTLTRLNVKRDTRKSPRDFIAIDVERTLSMYYSYITTGRMCEEIITQTDMTVGTRHYLRAIFAGAKRAHERNFIAKTANAMTLEEAMSNFVQYFGHDPVSEVEITKSPVRYCNVQTRAVDTKPMIIYTSDDGGDDDDDFYIEAPPKSTKSIESTESQRTKILAESQKVKISEDESGTSSVSGDPLCKKIKLI